MKAVCPTCKKKIDWKESRYRPFCSERCKLIDLGRWASGDYRIPAQAEEEAEKEAESSEGQDADSNDRPNEGGNGKSPA